MTINTLIVGDTEYAISAAYVKGALDLRNSVPYNCNPYRDILSQAHFDWNAGHEHESAALHVINDVDVILATRNGRRFTADDSLLVANQ